MLHPFRFRNVPALLLLLSPLACASDPPAPGGDGDACTARYEVVPRRTEAIVILDRSCAMRAHFDGAPSTGSSDPASRWAAARAAVDALVADPGVTATGLALFPALPAACDIETLAVEPDADPDAPSSDRVSTLLASSADDPFAICASDSSEVPLEAALGAALSSELVGSTGEPLAIVIAAGTPSCAAAAENLAALGSSFRSIVVLGLAPDPAAVPLFEAVGEYVEVASAGDLSAAVTDALTAHRASCVLDLSGPLLDDPTPLRVWADGELVAADPDQGWSYATDMTIALNGSLCDALLAGDVSRLDAATGCDDYRPFPEETP